MNYKKRFLFLVCLLSISISGFSQQNPIQEFAADISLAELKEHVMILASDEFEGRETGTEGQKKAAEYILEKFKEIGLQDLKGDGDPFYQEFFLARSSWETFNLLLAGDTLKSNEDFLVSGPWAEGDNSYQLVFVGYGVETDNYSSYQDIDIEGKIAVFFDGEPQDKNGKYLTSNAYVPTYGITGYDKARLAVEKGAIGTIMIDSDHDKISKLIRLKEKTGNREQFFLQGMGGTDKRISGMIALSEDDAAGLLPPKLANFEKTRKNLNKGKNLSQYMDKKIRIISDKGTNKISSENVLGIIRGKEYPDEYIIITAHYDHLGRNGDEIFNGADDNATGTAAVIEIAEAFQLAADNGFQPKRSILFMPVSGEEKGLLGSKFYTANPIVPLENTKAALNMDMIGRQDSYNEQDTSYVFIYVSDEEESILDKTVKKADKLVGENILSLTKYKGNNDFRLGGSDHASFENEGIPVIYYYCGTHGDYHRPSDTFEKIDYKNMTRISRMVFVSAWELANQ